MNKNIEINIDQLVLHGFDPADRSKIGEALELALMQAFSRQNTNSILKQSVNIPHTDGGSFNMEKKSKPANVGNAIANSIYTSLTNIK